jgi:hypothetical protein
MYIKEGFYLSFAFALGYAHLHGAPMMVDSVRRYIRNETLDVHLCAVRDPLLSGPGGVRPLMEVFAAKAGGSRADESIRQ